MEIPKKNVETQKVEINVSTHDNTNIVAIIGDIDTKSAPDVTTQVLKLVEESKDKSILLDMSQVAYMSSAGLRMLLSLHRNANTKKVQLILVGLSEELRGTMEVTGFLSFFTTSETVDAGLALLQ